MGLTSILLYKRIWAFIRQIFFIGSKGSWNQFALVYQSHSVEEIYILQKFFILLQITFPYISFSTQA